MRKTRTKAIMHFNKPGSRKDSPLPWTVHWRGKCYPASKIICCVQMESEFKPHKKQNPRAFFTAQIQDIYLDKHDVIILS